MGVPVTATSSDLDWRSQGACVTGGWRADWWTGRTWAERARAIYVCNHLCPADVRAACWQWALEHRNLACGAVYAGRWWRRGRPEPGATRRGRAALQVGAGNPATDLPAGEPWPLITREWVIPCMH
jgi:hypothetical protein